MQEFGVELQRHCPFPGDMALPPSSIRRPRPIITTPVKRSCHLRKPGCLPNHSPTLTDAARNGQHHVRAGGDFEQRQRGQEG